MTHLLRGGGLEVAIGGLHAAGSLLQLALHRQGGIAEQLARHGLGLARGELGKGAVHVAAKHHVDRDMPVQQLRIGELVGHQRFRPRESHLFAGQV